MTKMTRGQQSRAIDLLYSILINDLTRDCLFPSLQGKSEGELLHFALHAWKIDKPFSENAYNILCRLAGQEETDKYIFLKERNTK